MERKDVFMEKQNILEKAERFIYRNARPLDLARWKYHFGNGSANDVVDCLAMYQNEDGGFAYALEPDNWNTNSTPVAVWFATKILREIGFTDITNPVIQGILKYLDSGAEFANGKWFNTIASNNDYPHAIWWACDDDTGVPDDNPTVSLAGFVLKFADDNSSLYRKAKKIATEAVETFMNNPSDEMHTVRCFMDLLCYCEEIDNFDVFDLNAYKSKVYETIEKTVCPEPEKWYTDYVCKPSFFFEKGHRIFNILGRELMEKEAYLMAEQQLEDGSFPVTWQWWTDYKEFEVSANWWRSSLIVDNMLFLKALL